MHRRVAVEDAGRVHQDAERAERGDELGDDAVDFLPLAHVGLRERRAAARAHNALDRLHAARRQQIDDADGGALAGERLRDGAADTGATAGDDRTAGDECHVSESRMSGSIRCARSASRAG